MNEFFSVLFSPANVIATGFLCLIIVYWVTVIAGLMDLETLDVDIDFDVDVDVDVDVDFTATSTGAVEVDSELGNDHNIGNSSADISAWNHFLRFLNISRIPLMIWLSFAILPAWILTVMFTQFLGIESFLIGTLLFILSFVVSCFISKVLTTPFVHLFDRLEAASNMKVDLVGQIGIVKSKIFTDSRGQVSLSYEGRAFTIYAKGLNGQEINKRTNVLVIQKVKSDNKKENNTYLVEPYNHK